MLSSLLGFSTSSRSSRSGAPGAPGHAASSSHDGRYVATWISIDPRTGELSQYPEAAAYRRRERQVRLSGLGLGSVYETLVVDLGGPGEPPIQKRVGGGKRDVRRFEIRPGSSEVHVQVLRDRYWRICDESVPGVTQEL
eukprot:Skav212410  [mRNA]  locus=scaffold469:152722:155050:- [translate_table: standard]